ncbi:Hypothetical_protein [Hexamita inflata]|uniref:Hypothetical_protein n=1 Tax=Hexamita inflata TaxID=28002 RepID=A0ABP1I9S0_9EUKA
MRLSQIGCGRQNPPIQSAELPSTSLQDWKAVTTPLLPQKRRWYDAGGFPYRSVARSSRVTLLDACTRVVGCLGCGGVSNVGVSKTYDHSRKLTVPVQKTELVQTKVM